MINKTSFNASAAAGGYTPRILGDQASPNNTKGLGIGEAGRVRIGEMVPTKDGKYMTPRATDYFVFKGNFAENIKRVVGENPKSIEIFFPPGDFSSLCYDRLEIRNAQGNLYASGDGETFKVYNTKSQKYETFSTVQMPDLVARVANKLNEGITEERKMCHWYQALTLRFMIKGSPVIGYWELTTKGDKSSIIGLDEAFRSATDTFGRIDFFLPFSLSVKMVESNSPGAKKKYPVLKLTPLLSIEKAMYLREFLELNPNIPSVRMLGINYELQKEEIAKQLEVQHQGIRDAGLRQIGRSEETEQENEQDE